MTYYIAKKGHPPKTPQSAFLEFGVGSTVASHSTTYSTDKLTKSFPANLCYPSIFPIVENAQQEPIDP